MACDDDVGARFADFKIKTNLSPICRTVDLLRDNAIFEQTEIGSGSAERDCFGANRASKMVPARFQVAVLNPPRIIRREVCNL